MTASDSAPRVSTRPPSVRVFKSDVLEFFSHIHPATPVVIYAPVIVYCLYRSISAAVPIPTAIGMVMLGLVLWTLTEYLLHRFVFHWKPRSRWGTLLYLAHGVHHHDPNDATRLVMTPAISVPLAAIFYAGFSLVFGARLTPAVFAGLVAGYVAYDLLHYAIHRFGLRGEIARVLERYHLRHHYQDETRGFGVTSPLWDHVFRTAPR